MDEGSIPSISTNIGVDIMLDIEHINEFVEGQHWDWFMGVQVTSNSPWWWGILPAIDGEIWHACDDDFADAYPLGTMFCPRCNVRLIQEY